MDDSMKWDMLVAAAGNDLHDIMLESGIVTELRQAANEIPYAPYQPLVPEVPAGEDGNDITQRNTLMTGMPASNFDSWRIWGLQLKEQSQRCKWGAEYTWEVAALDALLYQCPDPHWKSKILGNPQWKFQEALDYGIRTLTSKQQGQKLDAAAKVKLVKSYLWTESQTPNQQKTISAIGARPSMDSRAAWPTGKFAAHVVKKATSPARQCARAAYKEPLRKEEEARPEAEDPAKHRDRAAPIRTKQARHNQPPKRYSARRKHIG